MQSGNETITFSIQDEQEREIKLALKEVYAAIKEKGYKPVNQIVGYILTEDPTYITNHRNARSIMRKVDRNELLQILVRSYLED